MHVKLPRAHGATPFPSCALTLSPQACTAPVASSASVCAFPPTTCTAVVVAGSSVAVNVGVLVVVPSPSCPRLFAPHAQTAPSSEIANPSDPVWPIEPIVLAGSDTDAGVRPQNKPNAHTLPDA